MTEFGAFADRQLSAPKADRQVVAAASTEMSEIGWEAERQRPDLKTSRAAIRCRLPRDAQLTPVPDALDSCQTIAMRWLPLTVFALLLSACQGQSMKDAAALRSAAETCGIENLQFERLMSAGDRQAENSSSPSRQFGQWWRERRARNDGKKPIYQTNVMAACGGFSDNAADERSRHNGKFDCLAKAAESRNIAVRPKCTVILE